jgi:hypothetical protein
MVTLHSKSLQPKVAEELGVIEGVLELLFKLLRGLKGFGVRHWNSPQVVKVD